MDHSWLFLKSSGGRVRHSDFIFLIYRMKKIERRDWRVVRIIKSAILGDRNRVKAYSMSLSENW